MEPKFDEKAFRHVFHYRVRSHECDRQGVVHNAKYLEMLEVARIEYSREVLKIPMDGGTFVSHDKFFYVHNATDYFFPARFNDEIKILTRIAKIGRTSVRFEHIMSLAGSGTRLLEAEAVMVLVDTATDRPIEIGDEMRMKVTDYQKTGA